MTFPSWAEPDFFTLEQICQRWSDWHCTVTDLIQLCRSDKIEISVYLPQTETSTGLDISGCFSMSPDDIVEDHGDYRVETSTLFEYRSEKKNKENLIVHFLCKKQFLSSDSMVITTEERDRLEAEKKQVKTTNDSLAKQTDSPMNSRKENGMLSVMYVMSYLPKLDIIHPSKAAGVIKAAADEMGKEVPSEQTIANYLKAANSK